jgi:hypothetical protein
VRVMDFLFPWFPLILIGILGAVAIRKSLSRRPSLSRLAVTPWMAPWAAVFPELRRFDTLDAQRRAWRRATSTPRMWVSAGIATFLYLALNLGIKFVSLPNSVRKNARNALIVAFMLTILSLSILFRNAIRRSLRTDLVRQGVPIRIECGYDLTGRSVHDALNVEPRRNCRRRQRRTALDARHESNQPNSTA